jgi:hypothetical protein
MSYKPKQKLIVKLKDPRRFLVNKENQVLQEKIFDTFVEWTTERLIDEVYLSLMSVKERTENGWGVVLRKYEEQARYKMYRMVIYRPPPTFIIQLKDLGGKVKRELAKRDKETRDFIIKQAAERIFEQIDSRYFLLSAKQFLKVRLEK